MENMLLLLTTIHTQQILYQRKLLYIYAVQFKSAEEAFLSDHLSVL